MQRLVSLVRTISVLRTNLLIKNYRSPSANTFQNGTNLLSPWVPMTNSICEFKIKGRVRRRCKSCYLVVRDERMYIICPKYPRHKQMSMKPKPLNTWILTHASQSPVRPW